MTLTVPQIAERVYLSPKSVYGKLLKYNVPYIVKNEYVTNKNGIKKPCQVKHFDESVLALFEKKSEKVIKFPTVKNRHEYNPIMKLFFCTLRKTYDEQQKNSPESKPDVWGFMQEFRNQVAGGKIHVENYRETSQRM